jgi:hypothetical protein
MLEKWLPVDGYACIYEVSNLGRVKSLARPRKTKGGGTAMLPERIKIPSKSREGYISQILYIDSVYKRFYVHRLVAIAFLENPKNHPQVNHIDGDKENNSIENLEWCSPSENCIHAIREGLYQNAKGESSGAAKISEADVLRIRELAAGGMMQKDIADLFPVGRKAITKIVNRQRWAHI